MGLIHGEWETKCGLVTDANGEATLTGFKGEYEITAEGKTVKVSLMEDSDEPVVITL